MITVPISVSTPENSDVSEGWTLSHDNIITGVPQNHWKVNLAPGECIDVVPIGDTEYAVRLYHIDDKEINKRAGKKLFRALEGKCVTTKRD